MNREMPLWEKLAVAGLRVTRAVIEVKVAVVKAIDDEIAAQVDRCNDDSTMHGQAFHRMSATFDDLMDRLAAFFGNDDDEDDKPI